MISQQKDLLRLSKWGSKASSGFWLLVSLLNVMLLFQLVPTSVPLFMASASDVSFHEQADHASLTTTAPPVATREEQSVEPVPQTIDERLLVLLKEANVTQLDFGATPDAHKVKLGEALFFDKILSGNQDISCATCHYPTLHSGDALSLSFGTGGTGLGPDRQLGEERDFVARNATELFNRGSPEWKTMFWDGRVSGSVAEGFDSPAESDLPAGLDNIVAVQAMFPVTSRDEMLGEEEDLTVSGEINELAMIEDDDERDDKAENYVAIWAQLMERLLNIPEYAPLFQAAYPDVTQDALGFQHAANALAAYQIASFSFDDSPWDRYLAGDQKALSPEAKEGALLFYGKADCVKCHAGNLMTDQAYHNLAAPQLGPGKGSRYGIDPGHFLETNDNQERFHFRTPPLRNVTLTAPWFHNGAYTTLEGAVRHHLDPQTALSTYDINQLDASLQGEYRVNEKVAQGIMMNLDPLVSTPLELTNEEVDHLLAFLEALTSPSARELEDLVQVPSHVPSGLPID